MASLMELVDRVNRGEIIDPAMLEVYQDSANGAEKFLAHHAHAMLELRKAHQHMLQCLETIEYSDQKVLKQFLSITGFLGLTNDRAQPLVKFGAAAIGRREHALGLEAIANGVGVDLQNGGAFTADRENCLYIATQFDRAAQAIGWTAPAPLEWSNLQTHIAYIVSGIAADDAIARTLAGFSRYHDSQRYKLMVYSTESQVHRDKQQFTPDALAIGSLKRGAATIETLARRKVSTWLAPADGDLVSAARSLADQMARDQIDVAIFDATQADAIAAIAASWDLAKVKMNLCRNSPLYAPGLSEVAYFDPVRWESDKDFWSQVRVDSRFILEGCDVEQGIGQAPQRSSYGIPETAMVLATAGNQLDRTLSPQFVDAVINILHTHGHAIFLIVGDGDLAWQKRKFEAGGVSKRIGYAGKRKDLPGFLRICDIYLAEFPTADSGGVMQAMCAQRPIVAIRWSDHAEQSQAAALVGAEAALNGADPAAYIERVGKLVREPAYRQKLGQTMHQRVEQHFSLAQTIQHLEQLCDQLIQNRGEAAAIPADQIRLAEVA